MLKYLFFIVLIICGCRGNNGIIVDHVKFEKRLDNKGKQIYWVGIEWTNNGSKSVSKIDGVYFVYDEIGTLLEEITYVLYEGNPVSPGQKIKDVYGAKNGADGYLVGFPGVYEGTVGGIPAKVEATVTSVQ